MALEQQVFSAGDVDFGKISRLRWFGFTDDNSVVPKRKTLEITTLTLNYFPTSGGTLGRANIGGRDSNGNTAWALQTVFLEPKKTLHLTFPKALRVEAGGFVEVAFLDEGPGIIVVDAIATLFSVRRAR